MTSMGGITLVLGAGASGLAAARLLAHAGERVRLSFGTALMLAEIVIQLLVLAFGLILLTQSFGLIQRNLDVEWVSLPLSVALVYIPIPIAGFAVVLQAALEIVRLVRERPAQ